MDKFCTTHETQTTDITNDRVLLLKLNQTINELIARIQKM